VTDVFPEADPVSIALVRGDWAALARVRLNLARIGVPADYPYERLFEAAYPGGVGGKVSLGPSHADPGEGIRIMRTPGKAGADITIEKDTRPPTSRGLRFVFTERDGADLVGETQWCFDGTRWKVDLGGLLASLVASETSDRRQMAARWVSILERAGVESLKLENGQEIQLEGMRRTAQGR